jgi:formate hydrogenlyase subunit 3/multisubunit Na+/H+ antiporter MnhD subunit
MDEGLIRLVVMIAIPFCFAGSLTAFFITYAAYTRGQNPDKRLAFRMALRTAFVALVVLAVISIAIGFALASIVE